MTIPSFLPGGRLRWSGAWRPGPVLLAAALLLGSGPCWAQTGTQRKPTAVPATTPKALPPKQLEEALRLLLQADSAGRIPHRTGTEAQGLVMDQTISKLGRDFYDLFYGSFEAPPGADDFTIVLLERQARANNAVVALLVNDTELFELPLNPSADAMAETAQMAVGAAIDFLLRAQSISRQLESGQRQPPEVY